MATTFQCPVQSFPYTYLGIPLSDSRLRKSDLQPSLDKLAGKVKGWNKGSFSLDARLLLLNHVLSAMTVFQLLVIDPPIWLVKAIDKLRRGFLWSNDEIANGGRCLVRWGSICRPKELGGLAIPDLQAKGLALRVRWLWQGWTQPDKPWLQLLKHDTKAKSLFNAAVTFSLGDGNTLSFWRDPWLDGQSLADRVPYLFQHCTMRNLSVRLALTGDKWVRHFKRVLPEEAVLQFMDLYERLEGVQLQDEVADTVAWRLTADGNYTSASAYAVQFEGSTRTCCRDIIWESDAPLKCRIFAWLAILGKCHTADCLMKKGWPHNAACVFCLSEPETALHLLATCPVIIRIWERIVASAQLPSALTPTLDVSLLENWMLGTRALLPTQNRKSWNAMVHLTWWTLWKERNARVFQNNAASLNRIHTSILDEARLCRTPPLPSRSHLLSSPPAARRATGRGVRVQAWPEEVGPELGAELGSPSPASPASGDTGENQHRRQAPSSATAPRCAAAGGPAGEAAPRPGKVPAGRPRSPPPRQSPSPQPSIRPEPSTTAPAPPPAPPPSSPATALVPAWPDPRQRRRGVPGDVDKSASSVNMAFGSSLSNPPLVPWQGSASRMGFSGVDVQK